MTNTPNPGTAELEERDLKHILNEWVWRMIRTGEVTPETIERVKRGDPTLFICEEAEEYVTTTRQRAKQEFGEQVKDLEKYEFIPVQVKEENPSAWAMYSEGKNKIFKAIDGLLAQEGEL